MPPAHRVTRRLREGDEVAGFTVLDVPGHSPGHIALWREADRTLICGDVFFNLPRLGSAAGLPDVRPAAQPRVDAPPRRAAPGAGAVRTRAAAARSRAHAARRRRMSEAAETLEREHELDRIAAALDATVAGSGRTLLIEGPAGIGKTRLLQDARALAKIRGLGRLHTTCDEFERAIPWGALRQMVERSLWRHDPRDARSAAGGRRGQGAGGARRGAGRRRRRGGDRAHAARAVVDRRRPRVVAAAADLRRRRAVVRRALAALLRLPRAPRRRPAGRARHRHAPAAGAPRAARGAHRRPRRRAPAAAPAVARRRRDPARRPSTTRCPRTRSSRRSTTPAAATRFLRASCSTTSPRAARTSAIHARHRSSAASARARSPAPCSPACPTTRSRWPGPPPCSARAATARWRRRSPA